MSDDNIKVGPVRDADTGEIKEPASETGDGDGSNELGAENFDDDDIQSYDPENDTAEDEDDFNEGEADDLTDPEGFEDDQEQSVKDEVKEKARDAKDKASEKVKDASNKINSALSREEIMDSKTEDLREFVRRNNLVGGDSKPDTFVGSEEAENIVESFARNVEAEERAEAGVERTEKQLQIIRNTDSEGKSFFIREDGEKKSVSKDQAVQKLETQKERLEDIQDISKENQKLLSGEKDPAFNIVQEDPDFQELQNLGQGSKTDRLDQQRPGGTDIEGVSQVSESTSERVERQGEVANDIVAVGLTPAGFRAAGAVLDPEKSPGEVIERKSKNLEESGVVDVLSSPAGLVASGAAGKVVGAGVQGVRASAGARGRSVLEAGKKTAEAGGAVLVGQQVGRGSAQVSEGQVSRGLGNILQVGAEAGVFVKGFRSGSEEFSPRLSGSSKVDQEVFLRQVADEDALRGVGKAEASTPVVRKKFTGGTENIGTASSRAEFDVRAGRDVSEASGTIQDDVPVSGSSERDFESVSRVQDRSADAVVVESQGRVQEIPLGKDDAVVRNTFRSESDGRVFRSFEDTSSTAVSRKESEAGLSKLSFASEQGFGTVDVDARSVRFSSFSTTDEGDEIFSESENIILDSQSRGGFSASGGSGTRTVGSGSGGAEDVEVSRQESFGTQFAEDSRRQASDALSQDDDLIPAGGSSGSGAQGEISGSLGGRQRTQDLRQQGSQSFEESRKVERSSGRQEASSSSGMLESQKAEERTEFFGSEALETGSSQDFSQDLRPKNVQRGGSQERVGRGIAAQASQAPRIGSVQSRQSNSLEKAFVQTQASLLGRGFSQRGRTVVPVVSQASGSGGFALGNDFSRPGFQFARSFDGGDQDGSRSDVLPVDWFSANLVEQKTGEEARLSSERGAFGLQAVQEASGEVEQDKIFDRNKGGLI